MDKTSANRNRSPNTSSTPDTTAGTTISRTLNWAPQVFGASFDRFDLRAKIFQTDTALLRRTPAFYEDSVYKPVQGRPNPFTLSEELLKGPTGSQSRTGKTALLVFFGKFSTHMMLFAYV
jgi:Animal haem peroxidase